ncbi:hypothetical protein HZC31_07040 [Candidatus Woesearchaeota archaeon]|nr:hypothetical protein [Candidatus Woesearchaeota archaeon]
MNKYTPSAFERKKYVLATQKDIEILEKCKELEKRKLTKEEEKLVKLIKTQLEEDWRTPLRKAVDKLLKK